MGIYLERAVFSGCMQSGLCGWQWKPPLAVTVRKQPCWVVTFCVLLSLLLFFMHMCKCVCVCTCICMYVYTRTHESVHEKTWSVSLDSSLIIEAYFSVEPGLSHPLVPLATLPWESLFLPLKNWDYRPTKLLCDSGDLNSGPQTQKCFIYCAISSGWQWNN